MGQLSQNVQQHLVKPNFYIYQPNLIPIIDIQSVPNFSNTQFTNLQPSPYRFLHNSIKYKPDNTLTELHSDINISEEIFPNMQQHQHILRNPEQEYHGLTHDIQNRPSYHTNPEENRPMRETKLENPESRFSSISTVDSRNSPGDTAENLMLQGNMEFFEIDHNNNPTQQHSNIIPFQTSPNHPYISTFQYNNMMKSTQIVNTPGHSQTHAINAMAYPQPHGNYFDAGANVRLCQNNPNISEVSIHYHHKIPQNPKTHTHNIPTSLQDKPGERTKVANGPKTRKKPTKPTSIGSIINPPNTHKMNNPCNAHIYDYSEMNANSSNFYSSNTTVDTMESNNTQGSNIEQNISKHATPLRTRKGFRKPIPIPNDNAVEQVIYDQNRREYTVFWNENGSMKYRAYQCKKYGKDKAFQLAKGFLDHKKKGYNPVVNNH